MDNVSRSQLLMKKYIMLSKIESGSSGTVFKARNADTGDLVAIKMMKLSEDEDELPESVEFDLREITLLNELKHEKIIRLENVLHDQNGIYLVLEFMETDLERYIKSTPNDPKITKWFMYQVVSAVAYCHSHEVIHRDLKPSNVLVNIDKNIVKLGDFGSARKTHSLKYSPAKHVATLPYRAPEVLIDQTTFSTASDIWSVGCIFAAMVIQDTLFHAENRKSQLNLIFSTMGVPDEQSWPGVTKLFSEGKKFKLKNFKDDEAKKKTMAQLVPGLEPPGLDLLSQMICLDPSARVTASELSSILTLKNVLDIANVMLFQSQRQGNKVAIKWLNKISSRTNDEV